jgi:hypothetical protein
MVWEEIENAQTVHKGLAKLSDPGHILFFEDIYPIPYHGQKSDIISYPLSRQKKG